MHELVPQGCEGNAPASYAHELLHLKTSALGVVIHEMVPKACEGHAPASYVHDSTAF
jgi:hypothetical protein